MIDERLTKLICGWKVQVETTPEALPKVIVSKDLPVGEETPHFSFPSPVVNGRSYMSSCNQSRWNDLNKKVKYKDSDVLIVTYPKCGTTWTEQVVLLLLNNGDASKLNPATKNSYDSGAAVDSGSPVTYKVWVEASVDQDPSFGTRYGPEFSNLSVADFDRMGESGVRVLKTHAPVPLLLGTGGRGVSGLPEKMKVVVVTR
jgi:hypothetical protein